MANTNEIKTKQTALSEDWIVVLLGFLIIGTSTLLFVLPVPTFSWKDSSELVEKVLSGKNLIAIVVQFIATFGIGVLAVLLSGKQISNFIKGFPLVFVLTLVALILTGNASVKAVNLEAVIFSLAIGLLIGNVVTLPAWFSDALKTELFVKIGLVLLGTSVIFSDILKAGSLGLIQALVVVVSVWYFAFWICQRFKLDKELSLILSSAVSICGVSAAIATAGAIKGDTKKLSYVISLVLVTAIPMMLFMPVIAKQLGLSEEVTGAWLGGSIDTTGAVVASGSLVGEVALKTSTIVKFSQNVLLGFAALAISVYWTYTKNGDAAAQQEKATLGLIWQRFPKFVIGFVAASVLFSFVLSTETIANVKDCLKSIQTLWFVLAFTCIGLETKFSDLFNGNSQKPLYAFLIAQTFNIIITLAIAYFLFR